MPHPETDPLENDDDFMSDLIETNPEFRKLLEERKKGRRITAEEMLRRLDAGEDEDLVDRLIENNPEFRAMLKKRLKEPTMPIKEAIRRLS